MRKGPNHVAADIVAATAQSARHKQPNCVAASSKAATAQGKKTELCICCFRGGNSEMLKATPMPFLWQQQREGPNHVAAAFEASLMEVGRSEDQNQLFGIPIAIWGR